MPEPVTPFRRKVEGAALSVSKGQKLKVESSKAKSSTKDERRKIAQLQELENRIAELESTLANLGTQLESPMVKPDEVAKIGSEYNRVQAEMDEKLAEWERMQV